MEAFMDTEIFSLTAGIYVATIEEKIFNLTNSLSYFIIWSIPVYTKMSQAPGDVDFKVTSPLKVA